MILDGNELPIWLFLTNVRVVTLLSDASRLSGRLPRAVDSRCRFVNDVIELKDDGREPAGTTSQYGIYAVESETYKANYHRR